MNVASLTPRQWAPERDIVVKPHLRGWFHLVATPLALIASTVLVVLAPTPATTAASAVFLATSLILFGVSAAYNRIYWAPRWELLMKRLDHSNIFLLIAGTYTPLAVALLREPDRTILLVVIWGGALLGVLLSVFWPTAPRWLSTVVYVLLGWVAVWYLPELWSAVGPAVVLLILAGGVLYTAGAVVYALKRPDPSPVWFGFHEIFHLCTVLAWACHCVAVYLAVLG